MALIAADAYLFSKAFEKAAILRDNHTVYHQTDKADTEWKYNGHSWVRESMIDRTDDGVDNPIKQQISATYDKTRELNALANARAVELELGKVPPPQNPFSIPARAEDQRGLDNANWHRNPDNGEWSRQVKSNVVGANDRGTYMTEVASPERARELDAEAVDRVQYNISNGREAVAAAYLQYRAEQRFGDFDAAVPAAVAYAQAKPDAVLGSDSRLYQRNTDGQWQHGGEVAQGNLALELDLTRQMRQPTLDQAAATLAQTESLPAPTPAEQERSELLHRYQNFNVRLDEEWVPAIELATARTREANGITGRTAQELQPVEGGLYARDSAITHYAIGSDGAARRVAVTTGEEVRQAYAELQAQRQDSPPIQEATALRIDALTPQQAEAHEQALREANRAGLSTEQAGQAAMLAAQMQGRDSGEHSNAIDFAAAPSAVERGVAADRVGDEAAVAEAARTADAASAAAQAAARPVELNESTNPPSPSTDADHARQQSEQRERDATRAEQEATRVENYRTNQAQVDGNERGEVPPPASAHAPAHPAEHPATNEVPEVALQPSAATSQTEKAHTALPEVTADQPVQPTSRSIPEAESLAERHSEPAIQEAEPTQERNAEHAYADKSMERELPPPAYEAQPEEALSAPSTPLRDEVPEQVAPAPDLVPADEPGTTGVEPSDPAHPAHALYRQVREQVEKLDESLGRNYDATSERLTDSLMVLAKESGLERVDHVVLSNQAGDKPPGYNVFVVQGELDNPAHRRVSMPTEQAVQTPHEESMARLDELLQHDAEQEQQVTQQRQQEHDTMQQEMQFAAMHMGGGGGGGG
ncbi:XVIPCD domain-containing protein [Stenotrophomonas sp.]|uniref:XVIPCD domain-containing protein n=1 Tax=Stenotrophomonas sp. TaxID=69392 RepID=UPI002898040D|nr:XVIPCD domain-containing protein [Stenotrophomonas sp.]